ncbi:hypothetical protein ABZT23_33340 [Streptomyces sp. NPDC005386]|uniref:hypothetical protein n=1 Tax=Streptomyces sp. NPDC005386 TaxID=3154562 RepID=UPI0033B17895
MQVERGLTLSEGVKEKLAWKSGLVFVAVEAVCVGAALWYPGELVWAFSTGCISPGELPDTSREMFDPFRVIAVMALVIISVVSTVLAYRIPLQQSEAKRRSVAALKGQLGVVSRDHRGLSRPP